MEEQVDIGVAPAPELSTSLDEQAEPEEMQEGGGPTS
jgi:hypothetical protein